MKLNHLELYNEWRKQLIYYGNKIELYAPDIKFTRNEELTLRQHALESECTYNKNIGTRNDKLQKHHIWFFLGGVKSLKCLHNTNWKIKKNREKNIFNKSSCNLECITKKMNAMNIEF